MIKTGLVSATFKKEPVTEVLSLCGQAGLGAIEWSEGHHLEAGNFSAGDELRKETEEAGIKIVALGSYYRLGTEENSREAFEKRIVSAKALGTDLIRIWAGTEPSAAVDDGYFHRMAAEAGDIAARAAEEGIRIAFEWHKNTLTDTNESAMRLMESLENRKNVYCLWQPTVALSEDERVRGIKLLGDRLANLHVYHWQEGIRRPLEEGRENWSRYFRAVDGEGDRYALMEFVMEDSKEQFLDDARVLNSWINLLNDNKE